MNLRVNYMNEVNKTLYIPLYGKAYVSERGLFISDKKAEEIWSHEGFKLKGKSKSKWLSFYMGIRAAVFDGWVDEQLLAENDAVVIHIGCGLDSRALRITAKYSCWYDVDFPEVIEERKKYFGETESYRMISADVRESGWLAEIPQKECAIVVMEGVSMYMLPEELKTVLTKISERFNSVKILLDCYTTFAAKASRYKNPINDVGVTEVFGLDDPRLLENEAGLVFTEEKEMTSSIYTDKICGSEKLIFKTLYAGKIAKKMYRLYEFQKM